MPALITHDLFGREVLEALRPAFITTKQETEAFLLGNQGPDPLFYCVVNPAIGTWYKLGRHMHRNAPSTLLASMSHAIDEIPTQAQPIARAYSAGFLCHYFLDSTAHPFIYAQQYALCSAGIDGLTEQDGSEVHAVIESELDEMMLYTRTHQTIATRLPHRSILQADEHTLAVVSYLLARTMQRAYGLTISPGLFAQSVHAYRFVQGIFDSPTGFKRAVLGSLERIVRRHSFVQAMQHRPVALETSRFDNHEHQEWINPFTGASSTESFADLFKQAQQKAQQTLPCFAEEGLTLKAAQALTQGINFAGMPSE